MMRTRQTFFGVLLSLLLGFGSATCTRAEAPAEVRLGYFANLTHAQAVLGVSSGEFQKALGSSKLTTRVFNAGPSLIEALFAGEIDLAYVGPGPVINAHSKSKGEALRVIAGAAANGIVIVARKDSGINSLQDLAGKTIATPQLGNTQDIAAKHFVTSELKQSNTNNVLAVPNADQAGALSRGQIDAAWAPEPWGALLLKQGGAKLLAEEKDLWPNKEFTLTVVVTTPEFLAKHPETVGKFLAVHRDFTKKLSSDPQAYSKQLGQAIKDLTGKTLPAEVIEDALTRVKFSDHALPETFSTFANWAYELGFSKKKVRIDGLIDESILKKLEAQK